MEISAPAIQKSIVTFLKRFHVIVYVVLIAGLLMTAVLILYATVNSSGKDDSYVSPANNTQFDQETIDRINQLKARDKNDGTINLPAGRTNPFVE